MLFNTVHNTMLYADTLDQKVQSYRWPKCAWNPDSILCSSTLSTTQSSMQTHLTRRCRATDDPCVHGTQTPYYVLQHCPQHNALCRHTWPEDAELQMTHVCMEPRLHTMFFSTFHKTMLFADTPDQKMQSYRWPMCAWSPDTILCSSTLSTRQCSLQTHLTRRCRAYEEAITNLKWLWPRQGKGVQVSHRTKTLTDEEEVSYNFFICLESIPHFRLNFCDFSMPFPELQSIIPWPWQTISWKFAFQVQSPSKLHFKISWHFTAVSAVKFSFQIPFYLSSLEVFNFKFHGCFHAGTDAGLFALGTSKHDRQTILSSFHRNNPLFFLYPNKTT